MMGDPKDSSAAEYVAGAEPPRRRIQLPASGLAEEILSMVAQVSQGEDQEPEPEPEESTIWVAFALDGSNFALPALAVREVVRVESLTRIPHTPSAIRGLATVRGKPLTVIDLGLKIGVAQGPPPVTSASRILALDRKDRSVGLLVDAIGQVMNVFPSRVSTSAAERDRATGQESATGADGNWWFGSYEQGGKTTTLLDLQGLIALEGGGAAEADRGLKRHGLPSRHRIRKGSG
jgi:purine-binding chemotaxis protein CheW